MKYFITAIGTDSGKSIVSAIFCEALEADYWKPVQAGLPRDTDGVRALVSNTRSSFHPEQYLLNTAASPHAAARIDNINISLSSFKLPQTENALVIEGAGGCLVPLNDENFVIDLASLLNAPVVLVSNHYLGSINHTLLTLEALQARNIEIKGLVFNGDANEESERIILHHAKLECLLRVAREPLLDRSVIKKYAELLKSKLHG